MFGRGKTLTDFAEVRELSGIVVPWHWLMRLGEGCN